MANSRAEGEAGPSQEQAQHLETIRRFFIGEDNFKPLSVVISNLTAYTKWHASCTNVRTVLNCLNIFNRRLNLQLEMLSLYQINALVEPGCMCLVLGRPNSGASTLLQLISGQKMGQFSSIEGDLFVGGMECRAIFDKLKDKIVYCSEEDSHYPFLTVEQTVNFAVSCKCMETQAQLRKLMIRDTTDAFVDLFGLSHAKDTIIGNDYVKGISGGEKKRVSLIECLATRSALMCFDNSTKGLDSSTALEYIKSTRALTDVTQLTTLININQASESMYKLFDKICIFHEGKQIFFGPVSEAVDYFEKMGFYKDATITSPDFLNNVIESSSSRVKAGYENLVPRTSEDFYNLWVKSDLFKELQREISTYKVNHLKEQKFLKSSYSLNFKDQLMLCCHRGFQNLLGSKAFIYSQLFAAIVQSLVIGSLFYDIPRTTIGSYSRGSLIFFSLLYFTFIALAEVIKSFQYKPIISKQKRYYFYTPSAHALSDVITDIPLKLLFVIVFSLIIYFLAHLRYEAGKFFIFVLFLWLISEILTALFQAVAVLTPTISIANAVGGILLLAIAMYATYVIQLSAMHPWFKWISYINPVFYGFEAMLSSELNKMILNCSESLIPSGPGYENITSQYQICGWYGATLGNDFVRGEAYLESEFGYKYSHVWRNLGILIGFWCFFILVGLIGSEFINVENVATHRYYTVSKTTLPKLDVEMHHDNTKLQQIEEMSDESSIRVTNDFASSGTFAWRDVNYVIPSNRKILSNVSGYIKPGTLTALMGESGAGKTTLLNALSHRTDIGVVSGDILINGVNDNKSIDRRTGFVQQQDLHLAELTVRESLIFSARLRRSNDISDEEKLDYVEKVISMLNMSGYADQLIGDFTKNIGLNPEKRKKVSIAVELVTRPSLLLFLDEPTSGFDSEEAISMVKILRSLADAGQAILCTIHQPSALLLKEFDNLLLLKSGGSTVYFGDISTESVGSNVVKYFEKNGAPPCSKEANPAEYILEQAMDTEVEWSSIWDNSPENKALHEEINQIIMSSIEDQEFHHYGPGYLTQLRLVTARTFTQFYRSPIYILAKFLLNIVGGLFIGFTFWDIGNSIISLQNSLFAVFMVLVISSPLIHQIQDQASQARNIYDARESKSKTFHWSILMLAQLLAELPYTILASTCAYVCFYFCFKRDDSPHIAGTFFLNYCIIFQLYYITLGLWIYYMSTNLIVSSVLVAFIFSFTVSFCGVMQPSSLMPKFWLFAYRVSPYTYLVEIFTVLMLHNLDIKCSTMELAVFMPDVEGMTCGEFAAEYIEHNGGYVDTPSSTFLCSYCRYKTGDEFLSDEAMSYNHLWRDFGIVIAFIVFNIFAMFLSYYLFSVKKVLRRIKKFW